MSTSRSLRRILALRALEQERQESALLLERQRRQQCANAIASVEQQETAAVRARFDGMAASDASLALASEMLLILSSRRGLRLAQELQQRERAVSAAADAWQQARNEKRQVETAWKATCRREAEEAARHEQKLAGEWYLGAFTRRRLDRLHEDESLQRNAAGTVVESGALHASRESA